MIFLVGYMASGKSTLARMAGNALKVPYSDTDELLEQLTGQTCAEYMQSVGESAFRQKEANLLHELVDCGSKDAVIATGGGLPCFAANMDYMNSHGTTVYLRWTPENLVERLILSGTDHRPLLKNVPREQLPGFVGRHLLEREPVYLKAQHTMVCDGLDDFQILEQFLQLLKT